MNEYDKTSIQINRCKRILELVDTYVDCPTQDYRTALRKALMEEFEAPAIAPPVAAGSVDTAEFQHLAELWRYAPAGTREFMAAWDSQVAHIDAWGAKQREAGALASLNNYDAACDEYRKQIAALTRRAEKAEADLKARDFFVDVLNCQVKKAQSEADVLFHRLNAANGHLAMARERIEELETEIKVQHRG